jgi:hypothetical protein
LLFHGEKKAMRQGLQEICRYPSAFVDAQKALQLFVGLGDVQMQL